MKKTQPYISFIFENFEQMNIPIQDIKSFRISEITESRSIDYDNFDVDIDTYHRCKGFRIDTKPSKDLQKYKRFLKDDLVIVSPYCNNTNGIDIYVPYDDGGCDIMGAKNINQNTYIEDDGSLHIII